MLFPQRKGTSCPSSHPQVPKRLRTRNEFVRGSPRLVELEQRYCFLFTSVNPNELSLPFYREGPNQTKSSPAKKKKQSLLAARIGLREELGSLGSGKKRCFRTPPLAERLTVLSLQYKPIMHGTPGTHACQPCLPLACVWEAYSLVRGLLFFLCVSCLSGNKFQVPWLVRSWEDVSGGPS